MMSPYKNMEELQMIIEYEGYKGINLQNLNMNCLRNLQTITSIVQNDPNYYDLNKSLSELPNISLEEIRYLTKKFYSKYFNLNAILHISEEKLNDNLEYISSCSTSTEFYKKINSLLTKIDPTELEIKLVDGHAMSGFLKKNTCYNTRIFK